MKKETPESTDKTIECFKPAMNEDSFIFPANMPPKNASSKAAWKNIRRAWMVVSIGLMSGLPLPANSVNWTKMTRDIMMIMNKKIATEK